MKVEELLERLEENTGTEFQKNFTKLMKKNFGNDYQGTQTYGNNGDRGLDGILESENRGYLIYAPEVFKEDYVIKKITDDFNNFFNAVEDGYWVNIKELRFIIKSNRQGITANIFKKFNTLISECDLELSLYTLDDIKEEFSSLRLVRPNATEINSLYNSIKKLKLAYENVYEVFKGYNFNTNNVLNSSQEVYANDYHNLCICIYNLNTDINSIRSQYELYFERLSLNDKIEKLLENAPRYRDDYICFVETCIYLYNNNVKADLVFLCDECLEAIKSLI